MDPLLVLAVGLFVVFLGLFCLIGIIYLMSFIFRLVSGERRREKLESMKSDLSELEGESSGHSLPMPAASRLSPEQRRSLIAAVSAAVAEYMGTEPEALRIHSIRRVGGAEPQSQPDRRELVAAVSAAIAMQLGTDVSGLRIHSIRKVG